MDANRDEALRCLKIADKHVLAGNQMEAKRFIVKAHKLYPDVDSSRFAKLFGQNYNKNANQTPPKNQRSPSRERKRSHSPHANRDGPHAFTKNQTDSIRKILSTKDHYQVLGVAKDASVDDIKKAYKILARKYHPDKNTAPGATDAFKKIGRAMETLTDAVKRKRYDEFGNEDDVPSIRRSNDVYYQYETHQGFDADVFNMFFQNGFPFAQFNHGRQHRQRHTQNQESEREGNYFVYLQLLPLVILFALSFFSSMMVKDPYFSLVRTQKYPIERSTQSYHIPYFVKSSFHNDFDGSLPQLERVVEEEYVTNLRIRCAREKDTSE
ncbi:hypothetical protein Ciccas_001763 [Cichlidogyrus casuarinus]|uniref:J domain-containing protein n=1 Tax=Cichlidogyrus casuarinus TaxID=1844966 RepID=A0ABD2QJM7_9PLAT